MSERTAWFCPSCQKHHAPHVETCPGPAKGALEMLHFGVPGYPQRDNVGYDPCANCGPMCGNAACPKALRAHYTAAGIHPQSMIANTMGMGTAFS